MELEQLGGRRLGKSEYIPDERTLRMNLFMAVDIPVPHKYDFDRGRKAFPQGLFGNDRWGNCVKVGQANQLLRLERIEQKRTLPIKDAHVIDAYKEEVIRQFGPPAPQAPGDPQDSGLYVLGNIKGWRNIGWNLDFTKKPGDTRNYRIAAYGELDPHDDLQLRRGIYLLSGIQMGFWLPRAAQGMTNQGYWDYNNQTGSEWTPGSWGGHLVYACRYDEDNIYVRTWGEIIRVGNKFVEKYCDEVWAVADDLNSWRVKKAIDVDKLKKYLRDIGATKIE